MGNICGAPRASKDDIDGQANIDSKRIGKKGAVSTHYISSNYKKASLENDVPQTKMIFQDNKKVSKILARIEKYEDITDRMEADVADYLAKVAESEMSESSSLKIRGMLSIIGDLERIGDIYYQMSKGIERKNEAKRKSNSQ